MKSDFYTTTAFYRAQQFGIDLTPELGEKIINRVAKGDYVWEGPRGDNNTRVLFIDHANQRVRLILNEESNRIITLATREIASPKAYKDADKLNIVLNHAFSSVILGRIRQGDVDEIAVEGEVSRAKMTVGGQNLRVSYVTATGSIIQMDDYIGPAIEPKAIHPALSVHAAERAVQRYGIEMTPELTKSLIERITNDTDILDRYAARAGTLAAVMEIEPGKLANIIYSPTIGSVPLRIITVIPIDRYASGKEALRKKENKAAQRAEKRLVRKTEVRKSFKAFKYANQDEDDY